MDITDFDSMEQERVDRWEDDHLQEVEESEFMQSPKQITGYIVKKQCTWADKGIRSNNEANPGSEISLCDKHNNELNNSIADLFK